MANGNARGSTLYCTLEPCCHYGRTPPCTSALVEAGIARAVIATKDPDPRVNGRGIEQLREASIDIDVGLFEEQANRLNESYAKFITERTPFLHGVIDDVEGNPGQPHDWPPSDRFVHAAVSYDAMVVSTASPAAFAVLRAQLARERHRPLVVAAPEAALVGLSGEIMRAGSQVITILFDKAAPGRAAKPAHAGMLRIVDPGEHGTDVIKVQPDLDELGALLGSLNVTGAILLPRAFDLAEAQNFRLLDKLTLVIPEDSEHARTRFALADLEFDLEQVGLAQSTDCKELTGYPKLLEIA
jgi:hypothetical protein